MEEIKENNQKSSYLKIQLDLKGINQKQVQLDLGVSQQYVSALIKGDKAIGKKMAKKLSQLYDLDETMLLGINNESKDERLFDIGSNQNLIQNKPHDVQMQMLYNEINLLRDKLEKQSKESQDQTRSLIEIIGKERKAIMDVLEKALKSQKKENT